MNQTPVGLQFFFGMIAGIVAFACGIALDTPGALYVTGGAALLLAPFLWIRMGWHGYTAGLLFVAAGVMLLVGGCAIAWRGWQTDLSVMVIGGVAILGILIVCILMYGGRKGR